MTDRTQDILTAVDHLITVHNEWESDPKSPPVPTLAFEEALVAAVQMCDSGDTPAQCREIVTQMNRLREEWNKYASGTMLLGARPIPAFWAAFRAVVHARSGAIRHVARRPEPVSVLLEQKVSYQQIAFHIYGDRGQGPFVDAAGQPDIVLIHKEAKEPGSVIKPDWVHPAEQRRNASSGEALTRNVERLRTIDSEGSRFVPDPASIEQLLREGQYAPVIARVKGVTVEEVYAVAERMGIAAAEAPNLAATRAPQEPQLTDEQNRALQPQAERTTPPQPIPIPDPASVDEQILEMLKDGYAAPDIAAELGITPQKVGAVFREHRKRSAQAAEQLEPVSA